MTGLRQNIHTLVAEILWKFRGWNPNSVRMCYLWQLKCKILCIPNGNVFIAHDFLWIIIHYKSFLPIPNFWKWSSPETPNITICLILPWWITESSVQLGPGSVGAGASDTTRQALLDTVRVPGAVAFSRCRNGACLASKNGAHPATDWNQDNPRLTLFMGLSMG